MRSLAAGAQHFCKSEPSCLLWGTQKWRDVNRADALEKAQEGAQARLTLDAFASPRFCSKRRVAATAASFEPSVSQKLTSPDPARAAEQMENEGPRQAGPWASHCLSARAPRWSSASSAITGACSTVHLLGAEGTAVLPREGRHPTLLKCSITSWSICPLACLLLSPGSGRGLLQDS